MGLQKQMERQGQWLFRWRSFLPIAFLPLLFVAVAAARWPFGSVAFHEVWEQLCLGVSFAGLAVRVLAVGHAPVGTSGRNTKTQQASSLNTTGMYSVVRHPLYLGNYLIALGAVLVPFQWWLPALFSLAFWLYYERIMLAEEGFLRQQFGQAFVDWAQVTPAFIPRWSQWRTAAEPFSWRSVLGREYTGFALVALLHCGIEEAEHRIIEHRWIIETYWTSLLAFGVGAYVVLRILKRRTTLLFVPGR